MANRHIKMLKITNNQINAMRYYLTPVRVDTIKKTKNNNCWQEYGEREPWQPLWKTVQKAVKILKIELPYDLASPLRVYLKKEETIIQKEI